jgi:hypothetical protein
MLTTRSGITALLLVGGLLGLAPSAAYAQKKDRDLITRADIDNSPQKDQDIYAVIRSLRPHFLAAPRGNRTLGNSVSRMGLYVDGVHETDVGVLKNILASTVQEVRYLDPTRSESEFGTAANGGAVVVKRLKEPVPAAPVRDTTKPPQR